MPTFLPNVTVMPTFRPITNPPLPMPTIQVITPNPTGTPTPPPQPMPTRRPLAFTPSPEPTAEPLTTATPAAKVMITFLVDQCDVANGQYCALVGTFNGWKTDLKYRLEWKASLNRWYGVVEFDKNLSYDYKLVKVDESGKIVEWESGANLKLSTGTSNREINLSWR